MPPPLYLESVNRIVKDTLILKLKTEKTENVEITIADYNQTMWHLSTPPSKPVLLVSVSCKCWPQLSKHGAMDYLKKIYGPMITTAEPSYDVTLSIDLNNPPENAATNPEPLATKVASLYRNMLAGPFHAVFDSVGKPGQPSLIEIPYRPSESMWFKHEGDRVICIFSICFDDPDDGVIGRVFLQEFGKNMGGAPAVSISLKDPPLELQGVRGLKADGYVSFLLESRHLNPKVRDNVINMISQFRNYTHYHIKCSKAYLHIRMRNRVTLLLQVLNRAKQEKPDASKTKTTASGRTFVRH